MQLGTGADTMPHFRAGARTCETSSSLPPGSPGDPPSREPATRPAPLYVPGAGSLAPRPWGGPARTPSGDVGPGTLMSFPLGTGKGQLCRRSDAVRGDPRRPAPSRTEAAVAPGNDESGRRCDREFAPFSCLHLHFPDRYSPCSPVSPR